MAWPGITWANEMNFGINHAMFSVDIGMKDVLGHDSALVRLYWARDNY